METYHVGLLGIGAFLIMIGIAFFAWRGRIKSQEAIVSKPLLIEANDSGHKALYVATTFADRPLERVIAHGLAHRGYCTINVNGQGLDISRVGEASFRIPASSVLTVSGSSAVIDKAVEKNGLVSVRWMHRSVELETHLRFVDSNARKAVLEALTSLVGA